MYVEELKNISQVSFKEGLEAGIKLALEANQSVAKAAAERKAELMQEAVTHAIQGNRELSCLAFLQSTRT
jgi:hypothetical protein